MSNMENAIWSLETVKTVAKVEENCCTIDTILKKLSEIETL